MVVGYKSSPIWWNSKLNRDKDRKKFKQTDKQTNKKNRNCAAEPPYNNLKHCKHMAG